MALIGSRFPLLLKAVNLTKEELEETSDERKKIEEAIKDLDLVTGYISAGDFELIHDRLVEIRKLLKKVKKEDARLIKKIGDRTEQLLLKLRKQERKAEGESRFITRLIAEEQQTLKFLSTVEVEVNRAIDMINVLEPLSKHVDALRRKPNVVAILEKYLGGVRIMLGHISWNIFKAEKLEKSLLKLEKQGVGILRAEVKQEKREPARKRRVKRVRR